MSLSNLLNPFRAAFSSSKPGVGDAKQSSEPPKPKSGMVLELGPNPDPKDVVAPVLKWSTETPLAFEYDGYYVKVIDDVFTPEECAAIIALAESDDEWAQAAVHYGLEPHQKYVNTDYRNSERILRFDADASEKIFQRLLPYIPELVEIEPEGPPPTNQWTNVVGIPGRVDGRWKLVGMNERLSFLRYGPGHYFRQHCDGQIELPDGRKSRVTVQIYLGEDDVEGGATRIRGRVAHYDVLPKKGRVLIFQQRNLLHSGEDVTNGLKYTLRSDLLYRREEVEDDD